MADQRPRSSYESDNVLWSKAVARRNIRTTIGQELRTLFKVPQDSPRELLQLLMLVTTRREEE
jgi:hypothetical protein